MINNRQNGRRRGRGGGPRTPNASPNPGNRQDNRSRGNAAQLHEKYKALARDSQLAGDRVQTEYYLQFADHYFRVLSEGRARFEEQRPRRDDFMSDEDDDQDEAVNASDSDDQDERDERPEQRHERQPRFEREDRQPRVEREARFEREDRQERQPRFEREDRPERNGEERPRRQRAARRDQDDVRQSGEHDTGEARIALDSLPPAISVIEGDETKPAPRRRTRRPRTDNDDTEIAPAA